MSDRPDKILQKLLKGFESFRKEHYETHPDKMRDLVENGQKPEALVFSCSDSRSAPEMVLGAEPGEIFVGRQIAALVPPYDPDDEDDTVAASIEFAVNTLGVQHIIVVGHTSCGGIQGLADDLKDGAVGHWIQRAREIKERAKQKLGGNTSDRKALVAEMERESVLWSLENLRGYPAVQKAMKDGRLQIHGWQFDMKKGEINAYDPQSRSFIPLSKDEEKNAGAEQIKKAPYRKFRR
ncbi:MAG: carbonic anhydrase [Micavibrio sp.]|nr:MAG: carbonic anhydrase [Micavibrio sp.]